MMDLLDKCSPSLQAEVWSGKNLAVFFIKKDKFCKLKNQDSQIHRFEIKDWMFDTRRKLNIPAVTLPVLSVFFDSFSITLLYSRKKKSQTKISKNEVILR